MNREDAAAEVKSRYAEYLQPARKTVGGKPTYICPLCGNGTGSTGDGMVVDPHSDGTRLKCFRCNFYGDIIDLYQQEHNCDAGEAFKALYSFFHIEIDEKATRKPVERTEGAVMVKHTQAPKNAAERNVESSFSGQPDFTAYFDKCRQHIEDPAAKSYLDLRGISSTTAEKFYLGFDPETGYIIIPAAKSFYVARSIDPAAKLRYNNPKGASIALFNGKALYNEENRPVFVTEGALDALSFAEIGSEAVALNSTSNVRKLLKELENKRTSNTLILCLDTDDAGRKATKELKDGLQELNIPFVEADCCGKHKDPNEALTSNWGEFTAAVAAAERSTYKPYNTADYVRRVMAGEIDTLKAQNGRKTGFANLDKEAGSLYAGLYVIAAVSSLGKTTFLNQLCDNLAAAGEHILYFSLEQSRLEMVSKSIARQTAKADPAKAVTSLQIRSGAQGESIKKATADYLRTVGDRVSIVEGNFACTVSFISQTARTYRDKNGVTPIIAVDYLQVLSPDVDPETGRKPTDVRQIVDRNLIALKRISRDLETPVIVISSVNRGNYLVPLDFESLKESGCIEFTADCIWGLQLSVMNDDIFNQEKKIKEKREKVADAKAQIPRDIELVCLKNRFGKSRYSVQFLYYPQYDLFDPVIDGFSTYYGTEATPWDEQKPAKAF